MPLPLLPLALAGVGLGGSIMSMLNQPNYGDLQRQLAGMINRNYGPDALLKNYQKMYEEMLKSPAFQQTLQGINASSAGLGANAARALGRTGASTSGIGALAGAAAQSAGGFQRAQARGGLSSAALNAAQQNLQNQSTVFSFGNQRLNPYYNPWMNMFGGLLGGGAMGMMQPGQQQMGGMGGGQQPWYPPMLPNAGMTGWGGVPFAAPTMGR